MDVADQPGADRTRSTRRPVVEAALAVAVLAVLGLLGGIAWWWVWEPSFYTVTQGQGAMLEPDLSRRFAADGWYAVIGGTLGLVSGLVLTWRLRAHRLVTLAALLVGSVLAVVLMTATGTLLGPTDTDAALAAAKEGSRVAMELEVGVPAFYLAWPVFALFGACLVLWGGTDAQPPRRHRPPGDLALDAWVPGARHVGRGGHDDVRART
ncbi:MAG: hypothetical protein Q8Q02_03365 [Nocardioides sp.]|nr:hypothetical protein [Nocardioides sp.]